MFLIKVSNKTIPIIRLLRSNSIPFCIDFVNEDDDNTQIIEFGTYTPYKREFAVNLFKIIYCECSIKDSGRLHSRENAHRFLQTIKEHTLLGDRYFLLKRTKILNDVVINIIRILHQLYKNCLFRHFKFG